MGGSPVLSVIRIGANRLGSFGISNGDVVIPLSQSIGAISTLNMPTVMGRAAQASTMSFDGVSVRSLLSFHVVAS